MNEDEYSRALGLQQQAQLGMLGNNYNCNQLAMQQRALKRSEVKELGALYAELTRLTKEEDELVARIHDLEVKLGVTHD